VEAISPRAVIVAVVVLACLVGLAAAALPAANTTAARTVGNATAAATTVATQAPTAAPNATAAPFTLVLEPAGSPAVFGDTVRCSGTGAGNATVRVLVDGAEAGRASPATNGSYRFDYLVDRVPAGTHIVRAEAGPQSAEASLEVAAVDPVVLLAVVPSEWQNQTAIRCTGNVTAGGRPVTGATVRLVFDGYGTADCITGPAGQFELLAGIAGGRHEVVANVSFADGRPINPGTSLAARVDLPGGFALLPLLGGLVAVLLVGGGGFFFWRRRRNTGGEEISAPVRPAPARNAPAPGPSPEPAPAPQPVEDLRSTARRLAGDGGRDGIEAVYHGLVERLAALEPGSRLGNLTPRELAAHFAGTPAGVAVARVSACYEAVAYSGRSPTPVDVETVVEGFVAALAETARAGQ
jgi:LPXTG-motif cell wall-anchored protein